MKLSEKWLHEWITPPFPRETLIHTLTMAGLAVESCLPEESTQDFILEFELTPNRGDCLSVLGIAREIAALTKATLHCPFEHVDPANKSRDDNIEGKSSTRKNMTLHIQVPKDCPYYIGCVVENLDTASLRPSSPLTKIQQKLKLSAFKLVHPVVDVMNYVMLELGQPLHAFDRDKIDQEIIIRSAQAGEQAILLDGKSITLQEDTLVVADKNQIHALAGIMGGLDSAVTENTRAIFIESAFFTPAIITGRQRRYGLQSEAAHRFERGVDSTLPLKALQRAIQLLSEIYDNLNVLPVIEKSHPDYLPVLPQITLRPSRVEKVLGVNLTAQQIHGMLLRLNMTIEKERVIPPHYRFDLTEEIDLIEEIGRLYGYEKLASARKITSSKSISPSEKTVPLSDIKKLLVYQGWQEIITYSFISEKIQQQFDPENKPLKLTNPLSLDYAVMRTCLWPRLMETVLYHVNRQQDYLRFFETGLRFVNEKQEAVLSGVWAGCAFPEQWAVKHGDVDFFDLKQTITQLFMLTHTENPITWKAKTHPALHPAQSAALIKKEKCIGYCGALHPELKVQLDIKNPVYLFEITLESLLQRELPSFQHFSKFPAIRRDLALIVDKKIEARAVKDKVKEKAGKYLVDIRVFDVYEGENLPLGKKSLAIGLIFQAQDKTLLEEEIQDLISTIITGLTHQLGGVLRDQS